MCSIVHCGLPWDLMKSGVLDESLSVFNQSSVWGIFYCIVPYQQNEKSSQLIFLHLMYRLVILSFILLPLSVTSCKCFHKRTTFAWMCFLFCSNSCSRVHCVSSSTLFSHSCSWIFASRSAMSGLVAFILHVYIIW